VPEVVISEINAKQDEASNYINILVANNSLLVKQISLFSLAKSINARLGIGEAEAIALATELQSDYVILDDFAARREAIRLGLNVKGTLAIIKKMMIDDKVKIDDLERFYQQLLQIKFRVKRSIFETIFID
jgi:predicted nucleic acid-binding protein